MTATLLEEAPTSARGADFRDVELDLIDESPLNPRKYFEKEALAELTASVKEHGIITPLLARPSKGGRYELGAGHRRLRAAKAAGLATVPTLVRHMSDLQLLEVLTIENLVRQDVTPLEEASGFQALIEAAEYDVARIADRVKKSEKYVYDRIKLLQLIPEAKKLLLDGTITPGHGILIARLSKDDQRRALAAESRNGSDGGVLESERIGDSYFPGEAALELEEPKKARSVRELQQWIARNVRFVPAKVDQADLAFDLPETAKLLNTAASKKLKVIKITREYRVPDQARDEKERTYGQVSWKRADGEPEPFGAYGPVKDAKPSKTCDHSAVGLIVAGPGRGEAFLVCVNKEKCSVHWAGEMKERAQRAKERERGAARNGIDDSPSPKPKAADPNVLPGELREKWEQEELAARLPSIVKGVKAVIAELKISDEICWNIVTADLDLWSWNKVGKRLYNGNRDRTRHDDVLEPLMAAQLPGGFESQSLRAKDGPGARTELAWQIWLARDSGSLDESIEKAVAARWTVQRKAAKQPKPAQTSAKAKAKERASAGGRK
jgi:ParB family chromosome partitioning protein